MVPNLRILSGLILTLGIQGETGYDAWLRYSRLDEPALGRYRQSVPAAIAAFGVSPLIESSRDELIRGLRGMLGRTLRIERGTPQESAIVLGTFDELHRVWPGLLPPLEIEPDGYRLKSVQGHLVITAANDCGVLYGTFALLRRIALAETIQNLDEESSPYAPLRWVNHWDNLNGTIERGYGGRSIFWDNDHVRKDLERVSDYGRLLASLGINVCTINNVNADRRLLSPELIPQAARIAAAFRPWGVRVAISVDFGSPKTLGGLDSFDPLDARVIEWWRSRAADLYAAIPDLAGFVIKADSEGRVGPSAYGRTHADAANVVARAVKPHGGLLFYRGFVYNHRMDWRNLKNDRARAAYDNFKELDGRFDENVVIQIKHGPIDFQVREPASPLFGALEKTNQAIELQITQEYFGQARHTVFLVPMWKETLDFDMHARGSGTPVKALVAGRTFKRTAGGFVGVSNVGLNDNWFGNHLSQANLYGYGRLAWDPDLSAERIASEWTQLTFGADPEVVDTIVRIQLTSWRTYENYTGPLGLQTLTDIVGNHYGVAVEASERNGWGQWHRSDERGSGMNRTAASGTGFIGQYRPAVARMFESLETCPDELILFLHHVPYMHKLKSGKTVIQHIYDSHYQGVQAVERYVRDWKALARRIDDRRFREVLAQLEYQAGQAQVWRDAVTSWFQKTSGVADAMGRVGNYPDRHEAEAMTLEGYQPQAVTPWETASAGTAVVCASALCRAILRHDDAPGWYTLGVQYFDQMDGVSRFRLYIEDQLIDEWAAADRLPTRKLDGSSSSRRMIRGVALRRGDEIRIEGIPDGGERAALDYLELKHEEVR
jgi:alpha-glucuronidase